jgi:5-methylthioribose kinase
MINNMIALEDLGKANDFHYFIWWKRKLQEQELNQLVGYLNFAPNQKTVVDDW